MAMAAESSGPPYPPVSFDNGIHFSSPDGTQYATINGQIAVNHSRFNGAYNPDLAGEGHFGQETGFQTARLGITGQFDPDWQYQMQIAVLGGTQDTIFLRQGYMAYSGIPVVTITLGKLAMNYGLDNMHDVYDTYGTGFSMLSGSFTPPAAIGATLSRYYQSTGITWNAGVYNFHDIIRNAGNAAQGQAGFLEDSAAYIGRFAWTLFYDPDKGRMLMGEVSGFFLEGSGNQASPVQANGNVLGTLVPNKEPPLSSGPIAVGGTQKQSNAIDVGLGAEIGPLSFETEYTRVRTMIDGSVFDHPQYDDAYIQGGWVITGEHRDYDEADAYLITVTPNHSYGAFELIARYEGIRLKSRIGTDDTETGTNGRTITAGLDWYLTDHVRFAVDASHLWRWGPGIITKSGNGIVFQGVYYF